MNISVGIMGHVDSGKTALARALSTYQSTAGFDKHPESQRRGITLDVGFSKFDLDAFQITLVDCPGHAAFIRSVLAGAGIVDFIVLVIDGERLFQQQTYESLVLMELLNKPSIVVLNKTDLLTEENIVKNLLVVNETLKKTKLKHFQVVKASAKNGLVVELRDAIKTLSTENQVKITNKRAVLSEKPFMAHFDHQFQAQGVGTVLTSTVLQGKIKINQKISIQNAGETTVKQLQVFKEDVQEAGPGDRVGICVKQIQVPGERGVLADQAMLFSTQYLYVKFNLSKHYKNPIKQGAQFLINFGAESLGAKLFYFEGPHDGNEQVIMKSIVLSYKNEYSGLITFETKQELVKDDKFIGLKLDVDKKSSRIAFSGCILGSAPENFQEHFAYQQNRKVEMDVVRRKEKEIVFKIPIQHEIEGFDILKDNNVVGKVKTHFGQDKWKGDVTDEGEVNTGYYIQIATLKPYVFSL
ncbi:Selenocysteine-specific_elongation factor [Hexamita inflata]|uniref:Selenocysteine-specific elongation factor n=1 Tax=Hexamita inflata TaxID=28002 RepID=A0AA86P3K8_9EUKA|nr:Selenocysteine-specific elongation factor [Hexamita inflata]